MKQEDFPLSELDIENAHRVACLIAGTLDEFTGLETERKGIFISRTDVIDEALEVYMNRYKKKKGV